MRKELSFRQKILLVALAILLLAGVVFLLNKLTLSKEITKTKREYTQLKTQYQTLESYVTNRAYYESELASNNTQLETGLNSFEGQITSKKEFYNFDRYFENFNIYSSAVTIGEPVESEDTIYYNTKDYTLLTSDINVSFTTTLEDFKKFTKELRDSKSNAVYTVLGISYNPEDLTIGCNATIQKRAIFDGETRYEDPSYNFNTGVDNMFVK